MLVVILFPFFLHHKALLDALRAELFVQLGTCRFDGLRNTSLGGLEAVDLAMDFIIVMQIMAGDYPSGYLVAAITITALGTLVELAVTANMLYLQCCSGIDTSLRKFKKMKPFWYGARFLFDDLPSIVLGCLLLSHDRSSKGSNEYAAELGLIIASTVYGIASVGGYVWASTVRHGGQRMRI